MSQQAQAQYIQAIKNLQAKQDSGQTSDPTRMSYGDFVVAHVVNVGFAHGNAQFFPFHRAMMKMWELALNANGYPGAAPYWDWASDASVSGLAKQSDPYSCVPDSQFSYPSYKIDIPANTGVGLARNPCDANAADFDRCNRCLRRCGNPGGTLFDAFAIATTLQGPKTYSEFRGDDRGGYHGTVHVVVGGGGCSMADGAWSPHAPEFYFHHMMVDKVWWKWQTQICPEFLKDYEGPLNPGDPAGSTSTDGAQNAHDYEQLDAWPFKVSDVLDTTNDLMCYTYSQTASDIPLSAPGGCPGNKTTSTTTSKTSTTTTSASTNFPQATWAQDILHNMIPKVAPGMMQVPLGVLRRDESEDSDEITTDKVHLEMIRMDQTADMMVAMLQGRDYVKKPEPTPTVKSSHHSHHQRDTAKLANIHGFVPNQGYGTYVRIKDQTFDIPEGYKIYSLTSSKAVLIPIEMNRNRSSLNITEAGDFSKAIVHVYQHPAPKQYIRPASFVAPDPNNLTHVQYPSKPQKWWTDMMNMDYNLVLKGWFELVEAIDKCNNQYRTLAIYNRVIPEMIFAKLAKITAILAGILAANIVTTEAACTDPRVRPEWRELSPQSQAQYFQAIKNLQANVINVGFAHNNAQFFPFHRARMKMWELALNANGYPGGAPCWDWASDASGWLEKATFFTPSALGGLAPSSHPYQCVPDDQFSYPSYKIDLPTSIGSVPSRRQACNPSSPDFDRCNHCLRRCGDHNGILVDAVGVQTVLQKASTYSEFRGEDAGGYHGAVHIVVGGVHHMMVDKVWSKFQSICPEFKFDYEGPLNPGDPAGSTSTDGILNSHDYEQIDAWPFKVSDVLDTTNDLIPTTTTTTTIASRTTTSRATATSNIPQATWAQDVLKMMVPKVDSGMMQEPLGIFRSKDGEVPDDHMTRERLQLEFVKMDQTADMMIAMLQGRDMQRKPTESVKSHHHYQRDTAKSSNIHGFVPNQGYGTYVRIKDQVFDIPEGYKIYSLTSSKAVLIPINMNRNRSSINIAEAGDFSKAIVHVYQHPAPTPYIRPSSFIEPVANDDTHVQYPSQPQKWWTDMMNMDYNLVLKGWYDLVEAIDKCNNQ
ncbi:hypothetical protein HDU76_005274, partial [Blyttiomyces sp. JEL0837]